MLVEPESYLLVNDFEELHATKKWSALIAFLARKQTKDVYLTIFFPQHAVLLTLLSLSFLQYIMQGFKISGLPSTLNEADLLSVYTPVGNAFLAAAPLNVVTAGTLGLAAKPTLPAPETVQTNNLVAQVELIGSFPFESAPTANQVKALLPASFDQTTSPALVVLVSDTVSSISIPVFYLLLFLL